MRKWIPAVLALAISICCYGFPVKTVAPPSPFNHTKTDTASRPPQFKDGGITVKKLKDEFSCEAIEFENWGDSNTNDSTLTVCLINSKKISPENAEQTFNQLRAVAANIKNALKQPGRYNAYYIIFVKREKLMGMITNAHTAGATITAKEL
jgi:hypothetical protein